MVHGAALKSADGHVTGSKVTVWGAAGKTKGGIYYKGSLLSVKSPPPVTAPLAEQAQFDPWESIVVEWDAAGRDEEFIQVTLSTSSPSLLDPSVQIWSSPDLP